MNIFINRFVDFFIYRFFYRYLFRRVIRPLFVQEWDMAPKMFGVGGRPRAVARPRPGLPRNPGS